MIIDNLDSITGNVERYPSIVTKPKVVDVLGNKYAVYGYNFKGLGQLYNFLKSNPNINTDVFGPKEYVSSLLLIPSSFIFLSNSLIVALL